MISLDAPASAETDIIIFDRDFPAWQLGSDDSKPVFFPTEGVLATVEVKSALYSAELSDALTKSVTVFAGSLDDAATPPDAMNSGGFMSSRPRTYVFGLSGFKEPEELVQAIMLWSKNHLRGWAWIPDMLLCGDVIALRFGDLFKCPPELTHVPADHFNDPACSAGAIAFKTAHPFVWFALHLMVSHEARLMGRIRHSDAARSLYPYYVTILNRLCSDISHQVLIPVSPRK